MFWNMACVFYEKFCIKAGISVHSYGYRVAKPKHLIRIPSKKDVSNNKNLFQQ